MRTFEFSQRVSDLIQHFSILNRNSKKDVLEGALYNAARVIYQNNIAYGDRKLQYSFLMIKKLFAEHLLEILNNPTQNLLGEDSVRFENGTRLNKKDIEQNLIEINKEITTLQNIFNLEAKKPK